FKQAKVVFELRGELTGCEICGEDGEYVPAKAVINDRLITVFAEGVTNPRGVRYLWTNYGEVTVYGKYGLPLAPFRLEI
ncbi:MAG: sialate O-acetylesterase, partial [Oscillospiraceae bacterium]|nr:sialate O-acetylesterase [Oscillospiraceae bacterium]